MVFRRKLRVLFSLRKMRYFYGTGPYIVSYIGGTWILQILPLIGEKCKLEWGQISGVMVLLV